MLIFISGGSAPYASGPHIWGRLPFKEAVCLHAEGETVDAMVQNVKSRLLQKAHLVGHDLGGLVALAAAAQAPERVRSVTAVASVAASPTGDGVPNLTFASPPQPLLSRESQRWALERVSYSHHHIDDALLDACMASAKDRKPLPPAFQPSLMGAKSRFYALCREQGYPVPAQVVWGTHDPLGSFEQGLWLFRILAAKQQAVHFHAINRAGSLLFREEPDAFAQVLAAFVGAHAQ